MQTAIPLAASLALARTLGALIFGGLLFWFVYRYQRTYLRYWAVGWCVLAVSLALGALRTGVQLERPSCC